MRLALAFAILLAPFALWFLVIKPRLGAGWFEVYRGRFWARVAAFRTWVAGLLSSVAIAFPVLADGLLGTDLKSLLGEYWNQLVMAALSVYVVVNRAFATTPREEK